MPGKPLSDGPGQILTIDHLPEEVQPAALNAAFGRPVSTDGTDDLPEPTGVGLEFVITAEGLDDIRYEGASL